MATGVHHVTQKQFEWDWDAPDLEDAAAFGNDEVTASQAFSTSGELRRPGIPIPQQKSHSYSYPGMPSGANYRPHGEPAGFQWIGTSLPDQFLTNHGSFGADIDAGFQYLPTMEPFSFTEELLQSPIVDAPLFAEDVFRSIDFGVDGLTSSPTGLFSNSFDDAINMVDDYDPRHKAASTISTASNVSGNSYETAPEEASQPVELDKSEVAGPVASTTSPPRNTSDLVLVSCGINPTTGAMAEAAFGDKRRGIRTGPLSLAAKANAARMRKKGVCATCKHRRSRCDVSAPYCTACVRYHGGKLLSSPSYCRNKMLENLADNLFNDRVFPRNRTLESYLGSNYEIDTSQDYLIHLNVGFGQSFLRKVRMVKPGNMQKLIHEHVVYPWQVDADSPFGQREISLHEVFSFILSETSDLPIVIDQQLDNLVNDQKNFAEFPLFRSDLEVLREIYIYYLDLAMLGTEGRTSGPDHASLLRDALKLLIAVHIGGDTRIEEKCVCKSRSAARPYYPSTTRPPPMTPCFIRGQLGPVFAQLALDLARRVLRRLEVLSLAKDCKSFPVIIATFSVLFMAVESIQYHANKIGFHALTDGMSLTAADAEPDPNANEPEAVQHLLNFYRICMGNCHMEMKKKPMSFRAFSQSVGVTRGFADASTAFLSNLNGALDNAAAYLERKLDPLSDADSEGMSCFFDKQLAKFFLLRTD